MSDKVPVREHRFEAFLPFLSVVLEHGLSKASVTLRTRGYFEDTVIGNDAAARWLGWWR